MFDNDFLDIPALQTAGGCLTLPGSKSISNRVLLLAALCDGPTTLHDLLDSDDTRVMLDALRTLGCTITQNGSAVVISGMGGCPTCRRASLFMGNAGTAIRPLTAALALIGGDYELRGVPRMHERPIGDLVDALRQLGCQVDYLEADGYPPLHIGRPSHLRLDAPIKVRGDVSSQFLTALLMALPLVTARTVRTADATTGHDVVIEVDGPLISRPYVQITLNLLERFGVKVQRDDWKRFTILAGSQLQSPGEIHVEADASSASYFIAAGAIALSVSSASKASTLASPNTLKICGVGANAIQGDIRFVDAARMMGAQVTSGPNWFEVSCGTASGGGPLQAIDLDCNHIPDAAMTLAMMALYANGTTTLRNIASWRVKETDRIDAMACELRKLGATVTAGPDFISITPPSTLSAWRAGSIRTYDDHRMAMCFSLAAFNPAGLPVRILKPQCVAKTFPDYFETLFALVRARPHTIPVLCIDGPTASGKGTLARALAQRLGYHVLDSGALYRVTALAARQAGLRPDETGQAAIAQLIPSLDIAFNDHDDTVLLQGQDVTAAIRHESIGILASQVSALPQVRTALMDRQHRCRQLPGLVADGRDMGTVVFPDAPLKVFLTASVETRALRRFNQLISKGISPTNSTTLDRVCDCLKARDLQDTSRSVAPLGPATDAMLLDNSDRSIDQSAEQVLGMWQSKQPF